MKKIISILLLAILLFSSVAMAASPSDRVWFQKLPDAPTEKPLAVGDKILIYAQVDNATPDAVTYTVKFADPEKEIGTKVATVSAYTGQSLSITSTMPETPKVVTATITKAVGKNKKEIKAFEQTIGSVTVTTAPAIVLPDTSAVRGWVGNTLTWFEDIRLSQLAFFTELKTKHSDVLATTTLTDVRDILKPEAPTSPSVEVKQAPVANNSDKTIKYIKLAYASMGKAFFEHKALYYVIIVLSILFVVRFVVGKIILRS